MTFIGLTYAIRGVADAVVPRPASPQAVWPDDEQWLEILKMGTAAGELAQAIRNGPHLLPDMKLRWTEHTGPRNLPTVSAGLVDEGLEILDYVSGCIDRVRNSRMSVVSKAIIDAHLAVPLHVLRDGESPDAHRDREVAQVRTVRSIVHRKLDLHREMYGSFFHRAHALGFVLADLLAVLDGCDVPHALDKGAQPPVAVHEDWLATPAELIAGFGTPLCANWFKSLGDRAWLLNARKHKGQGQRGRVLEPLFCPRAVLEGLMTSIRPASDRFSTHKGWHALETKFPRAYARFCDEDPRPSKRPG